MLVLPYLLWGIAGAGLHSHSLAIDNAIYQTDKHSGLREATHLTSDDNDCLVCQWISNASVCPLELNEITIADNNEQYDAVSQMTAPSSIDLSNAARAPPVS